MGGRSAPLPNGRLMLGGDLGQTARIMRRVTTFGREFGGVLRSLGPGVRGVALFCGVCFVAQSVMRQAMLTAGASFEDALLYMFAFSRIGVVRGFLWQPLTYMFLHGSLWHLLLNLLLIVMLGSGLERMAGTRRFWKIFLVSGMVGGIGWFLISGVWAGGVCLGASAAAFGIIGGFAGLYPRQEITLLLLWVWPITMRARTLALWMCAASLIDMLFSRRTGVAYSAHLMGCVGGYVYALLLSGRVAWWPLRLGRLWPRPRPPRVTVLGPPRVAEAGNVREVVAKVERLGIRSLTPAERAILDRAASDGPVSLSRPDDTP